MTVDPQQRDNLDTFLCEVLRLPKDDQCVLPLCRRPTPEVVRIYVEVRIEKKAA